MSCSWQRCPPPVLHGVSREEQPQLTGSCGPVDSLSHGVCSLPARINRHAWVKMLFETTFPKTRPVTEKTLFCLENKSWLVLEFVRGV